MTPDEMRDYMARRQNQIGGLLWLDPPKWRTAVAELGKLAEEIGALGEQLPGGLLDGTLPNGHATSARLPSLDAGPQLLPPGSVDKGDIQEAAVAAAKVACGHGAHAYTAPDSNGWRTCTNCGNVSIT